jgi:hypothetical protein
MQLASSFALGSGASSEQEDLSPAALRVLAADTDRTFSISMANPASVSTCLS